MMHARARGADPLLTAQRRLFALGACACVALILRTVYLQTRRNDYFTKLGDGLRGRTRVLPPRRGDIVDRLGVPLAAAQDVARVEVDPTRVPPDKVNERALYLAEMLGMSVDQVLTEFRDPPIRGRETARNKIIQEPVPPETARVLRTLMVDRDHREQLEGVVVKVRTVRAYNGGSAAIQLVGLCRPTLFGLDEGTSGVERWANVPLSGSPGWLRASVDPRGRPIATSPQEVVPAVDGLTVKLTIDQNIQSICAQELAKCMTEHTPFGATAIVLDPATGDVLAMASVPTIEPEHRSQLGSGDERLRNRALELLEPGSVMKPFTGSIALDLGVITDTEVFACPGYTMAAGKRINCEAHKNTLPKAGTNTIRGVVVKSCNVAAAHIALRLGAQRLEEGLRRFGLLDPTGVQLIGDKGGSFGFDSPHLRASRSDVARVGFGQSVLVTPLGMAAAFGAIANGGVLMRTRLVQSFVGPGGRTVREFPTQQIGRAVSPEVAEAMRGYLEGVVESGTGNPNAVVPGFSAAGKTGTAQKAVNGVYREHIASFMGFVPARKPRAAIVVTVDEPRNGYHGAQAAAPTWSRIAERLMWYWNVAPDKPETSARRKQAAGSATD